VVVGIALVTLVPVGAAITTAIDEQYKTSLVAEETAQEADETSATVYEENANQDVEQDQNILEMLGSAITSGIDALASGAADAANAVGEQLNKLIDAVAVTIVTSCLVPLAVLLLYFWLIKLLTGADFTGYVSRAQNAASSSVRKADSATRAAVKQHRASTLNSTVAVESRHQRPRCERNADDRSLYPSRDGPHLLAGEQVCHLARD
jgi:hypothetical protein